MRINGQMMINVGGLLSNESLIRNHLFVQKGDTIP